MSYVMTPSQQRYLLIGLLVAGAVIVLMAVVIALTRSQRDIQVASPAAQAPSSSGGFSFFNVDRTTVLTHALRENLSDTLGSDAIAHATPIDLTVVSPGFLQTHLPQIATLNRGFNPPLGGRREHDTTRLTYHRAESRQMPFRYVELVFSSRNGLPLYFLIEPTADFADSTATLSAKYGSPRQVETEEQRYPVQIWEKDGDVLVASTFERRNGRLSQQLRMYFVDNLRLLLQAEEEARRREDRQTRRAAERAF
jgi:hypothetical protein